MYQSHNLAVCVCLCFTRQSSRNCNNNNEISNNRQTKTTIIVCLAHGQHCVYRILAHWTLASWQASEKKKLITKIQAAWPIHLFGIHAHMHESHACYAKCMTVSFSTKKKERLEPTIPELVGAYHIHVCSVSTVPTF